MSTQSAREVALPIAVVLGLLVNAIALGFFGGRVSQRLDQFEATISSVIGLPHEVTKLRGEIAVQEAIQDRRLQELETNAKLLGDYTRGRISRLPYRP